MLRIVPIAGGMHVTLTGADEFQGNACVTHLTLRQGFSPPSYRDMCELLQKQHDISISYQPLTITTAVNIRETPFSPLELKITL